MDETFTMRPLLRAHPGQHGLGQLDKTEELRFEHLPDGGIFPSLDRGNVTIAYVVNQHIDPVGIERLLPER